jgi:hypothetical protein
MYKILYLKDIMKRFFLVGVAFFLIFMGCNRHLKETKMMNKDTFLAIIEKTKDLNTEIMYSNLIEKLKNLPEKDVQIFRAYIDGYMELSSETIWIDMACKVINGYVSDDTGLYFILWLISRGETVLLKALNDPDTLSELPEIPFGDADFEMLMGIGMDENEEEMDYELMEKLKEKIIEEIAPTIKYKDGERYGKYETFEDGMEDIPNVLPKLIKRAEMEEFDWRNYI